MNNLAIYVHLPWCIKKCPYCDFNSHQVKGELAEAAYTKALLKDLRLEAELRPKQRTISSIFFGGGTPSLFSPKAFAAIIDGIAGVYPLQDDVEITMEANPGTLEHSDFNAYHNAGINRISLGVQSFNDKHLATLGRIHQAAEAKHALARLQDSAISRVNVDLMYALPEQTVAEFCADLDLALQLTMDHLSVYQLTIEPNTLFHHRPPPLPDDERVWDMQEALLERTEAGGLERYEISAYARKHGASRHNLNYWRFGDYLGIGAGAHGKYRDEQGIHRYWKTKHPEQYQRQAGNLESIAGQRTLSSSELPIEFLMNGLRLSAGFTASQYEQATGLSVASLQDQLKPFVEQQLLVWQQLPKEQGAWRIGCSERGFDLLDSILAKLI